MAPPCCKICVSFVNITKYVPVLFITSIIAWSYYAYVVELCFKSIESATVKVFYLVFYHVLLFMFLWSYYKTTFTSHGKIPQQFYLSQHDADEIENAETQDKQRQILAKCAKRLPVYCRTMNGCHRFCEKCQLLKPDRCHHCSVCGICVLKMDHHCPWVNNCISFTNYKFFVLFLGYGLWYCLYVAFTSLPYFLTVFELGYRGVRQLQVLFLFFVACLFAISLVCLFGYHLFLISRNRTTLETFRTPMFYTGPDANGFNLGLQANFQEIFGNQCEKWFLPIFTSFGDGLSYPTRTIDLDTERLLGDPEGQTQTFTDDVDDHYVHFNGVSTRLTTIVE